MKELDVRFCNSLRCLDLLISRTSAYFTSVICTRYKENGRYLQHETHVCMYYTQDWGSNNSI